MAHTVFVSYASQDRLAANAICIALEQRDVHCWIDHRHILPGQDYGQSIIQAINEAPLFLLLLSANSNASPQVAKEVERANTKRKTLLVLRLDATPVSSALEYHISNIQHFNPAALPWESQLEPVAEAVRALANVAETPPEAAPVPGVAPFMGLHPFDEADAANFFGRETLVTRLAERIRRERFLVVVIGASGSGKSSMVRAGLVPRLRGEFDGPASTASLYRYIHILTPTAHPLETLALSLTRMSESLTSTTTLMDDLRRDPRSLHLHFKRILPGTGQRALLVVDQCEELFTLCREEPERTAFINAVMMAVSPELAGPTTVVITLRADFYARCAPYPALREAVAKHQEYIGPMSAEEVRRAIEEPARRGGWELEPGLVETLLKDVGDEPGALPLLSHALLETWQRRRGRTLTLRGYAESGGVRGAIAKTAESVCAQLTAPQQVIARDIFVRLTELKRREDNHEMVQAVLTVLIQARLVTTDDQTAEVAHEALIREWPTLRAWLDEDREGLRLHRQLSHDVDAWQRLNRDEGLLYRGGRLAQANEWAASHAGQLSGLECEFLAGSQALADRELAEREAQRRREVEQAQQLAEAQRRRAEEQTQAAGRLQTRNRVISVIGGLALLAAFIAIGLGLQANRNLSVANQNAATAQAASTQSAFNLSAADQSAAMAQAASTQAVAQRVTADAASTQAVEQRNAAANQAQIALVRQLAAQVQSVSGSYPVRGLLLAIESQAVASQVVQGFAVGTQSLRDTLSQVGGTPLRGHENTVTTVAFSPDGRWLATGSLDHTVRVWNLQNLNTESAVLRGHEDSIWALAFSPDGRWLATGSNDATARVWDLQNLSAAPAVLRGHANYVHALAFSPDGRWLATGSNDATARIWDMHNLDAAPVVLHGHENYVRAVAFSPDGRWLATGSNDATARVWDMQNLNAAPVVLHGHQNSIWTLAFSPNGHWLATGGEDATVQVWDFEKLAAAPVVLRGHGDTVTKLAFSPDGHWLATGSWDHTARVWDLRNLSTEPVVLHGHEDSIATLAFSPDGRWLATGSLDGTARIWNVETLQVEPVVLRGHENYVNALAFSPDGHWLATGSWDHSARVWDMQKLSTEPIILRGHEDQIRAVAFSPDGHWLATGSNDATARVWDMQNLGAAPRVLPCYDGYIYALAFSPEGQWLATESSVGAVQVWNMQNLNAAPVVLYGRTHAISPLAFSPSGRWLVIGGSNGQVQEWDLQKLSAGPVDLLGHWSTLTTLVFNPDGHWLAEGSSDGMVQVRNMQDQTAGAVALRGNDIVTALAFSPDGRWLATGSKDSNARLWDLQQLKGEPNVLDGHQNSITTLAFSPDGRWLATGSMDATAQVWDMQNQAAGPVVLRGHEGGISTLAISPNGRWLATGSADKTVRLWDIDVNSLVDQACAVAGRNLTQAEWQQYLSGLPYRRLCEQWPDEP